MTTGLVGQDQITTFTSPVNGTSPIDANVVRGNDNTVKTAFNVHDADASVHLQSSVSTARPPAGVPGRKWLDTDTMRLWYDDGAAWHELAYMGTGGGVISGNIHITGTLAVDGATTLAGATMTSAHVTGPLTVDGATTLTGVLNALGGISSAANIYVNGPTLSPRGLIYETGGTLRWFAYEDASPESGANAGSNYVLTAYNDAGNPIDSPISINRAAGGPMILSRPLTSSAGATFGGTVVPGTLTAFTPGSISTYGPYGLVLQGKVGSQYDFTVLNAAGNGFVLQVPTGTTDVSFGSRVLVPAGPLVVGTDPGGGEMLRVAGSTRTAGIVKTANTAAALYAEQGQVEHIVLTGSQFGPQIRARWDGSTANRYLDIGTMDNTSAYSPHVRYDANTGGLIIFPDPGGTQLLRVGGAINASGAMVASTFSQAAGPPGSPGATVDTSNTSINIGINMSVTLPGVYGLLYLGEAQNTGNAALILTQNYSAWIIWQTAANYFSTVIGTAGKINVAFNPGGPTGVLTLQNLTGIAQTFIRFLWFRAS